MTVRYLSGLRACGERPSVQRRLDEEGIRHSSYSTFEKAGHSRNWVGRNAMRARPDSANLTTAQALIALTALGVVFGDIGTSSLYALREAVKAAAAGGAPTPGDVLGVISLILWSLFLIISVKYAVLIMRADNHGEGGIL